MSDDGVYSTIRGALRSAARTLWGEGGDPALSILLLGPDLAVFLARVHADARVPPRSRLLLPAALAHAISPVGVVKDATAASTGLGDDWAATLLALDHVFNRLPPEVVRDAWSGAPEVLERIRGLLSLLRRNLPQTAFAALEARVVGQKLLAQHECPRCRAREPVGDGDSWRCGACGETFRQV